MTTSITARATVFSSARIAAARKRIAARPEHERIGSLLITARATSWAGIAKVNARRQALADARALLTLAVWHIRAGRLSDAQSCLCAAKIEKRAADTLSRII